jgi:hypothetical protein
MRPGGEPSERTDTGIGLRPSCMALPFAAFEKEGYGTGRVWLSFFVRSMLKVTCIYLLVLANFRLNL